MNVVEVRQNPYGQPLPAGITPVRVGKGARVHAYDQSNGILCKSGKGRRLIDIAIFRADAHFITCYRCQKLLHERFGEPLEAKDFSPSNPRNRTLHRQIPGGRSRSREVEGPLPKIRPATLLRLYETDSPAGARTQSPKLRQVMTKRVPLVSTLAATIQAGLAAYLSLRPREEQRLGLHVPFSAEPLIASGIPSKAAHILVSRAGGKLILRELSASTPPLPLRDQIEAGLGLRGFRMRGYELVSDVGEGEPYVLAFMRYDTAVITDAAKIRNQHDRWLREQRFMNAYPDDNQFLSMLWAQIDRRVRERMKEESVASAEISITFLRSGDVVDRTVLIGEHSKFGGGKAKTPRVEYRYLRNVSLTERGADGKVKYPLAQLLAQLTLRKKRKGRKLTPI